MAGLAFILLNRPFYQRNHYTCSSYIARLLEEAGICRWKKHFSLVTPKDFYVYEDKKKIFEGSLRELTDTVRKGPSFRRSPVLYLAQPPYAGAAYVKNILKRGMNYER